MNINEITNIIVNKLQDNRSFLQDMYFSEAHGTSTKFFYIDNLLPNDLTLEIYENFPSEEMFFYRDNFREKKYSFAKINEMSSQLPAIVTDSLQSKEVLKEIELITKTKALQGDQSLYAGGLSRMDKTHFLNPHIDNSHDANRTVYRRFNSLFYVTPDVKEDSGGNLELWCKKVRNPVKIWSKFNRLVVMETSKDTWHSVDPVVADIKRCCVSNYYFSKSSPAGGDYYHVTSFIGRPGQRFQRLYGKVDNFLRQKVAVVLGISRGKKHKRQ